jgi:hypothetical protein
MQSRGAGPPPAGCSSAGSSLPKSPPNSSSYPRSCPKTRIGLNGLESLWTMELDNTLIREGFLDGLGCSCIMVMKNIPPQNLNKTPPPRSFGLVKKRQMGPSRGRRFGARRESNRRLVQRPAYQAPSGRYGAMRLGGSACLGGQGWMCRPSTLCYNAAPRARSSVG